MRLTTLAQVEERNFVLALWYSSQVAAVVFLQKRIKSFKRSVDEDLLALSFQARQARSR